jgi:hypothetical protein
VTLINKGDINKEEYNFAKPSTIPANSSSLIGSAINSVNKEILKDENNISYVVRNRAGYYEKIYVNVLRNNNNYSIVKKRGKA